MFPLHGPAPTNLPPGSTAAKQRQTAHQTVALKNSQPGLNWPRGSQVQPAAAAPTAAQALVRGAGAVGLLYGGLWLALAAYRAVKKRLLRRALMEIVPALQKAGVTFWVDFGSLMSLARNNDVYEYDNDVDLVVWEPDFPALLEKLRTPGVLPKGFTAEWIGKDCDLGDGLTQRWLRIYLPAKVMWADLFGGFDFGSKIRINKSAHCDVPKDLVMPLGTIPMFNSTGPAPRDVEGVLEHRYGPDWCNPKHAIKATDQIEHNKRYLRLMRCLGRLGLRI